MDAQPGSHSKAPVNVFATCYHGLQSKHHSGLNYSDSLISHDVVGYVISSSNDRLWELYLIHVSICATSNPLNEFKVMLRVPPLDFIAWSGKDIHGTLTQRCLYIYLD